MELYGHLEGMLDRDQRTAKMPVFCIFDEEYLKTFIPTPPPSPPPNQSVRRCCCKNFGNSYFKSKKRYLLRTLRNFGNVLVVGLYFILVALPPASSAPASLCFPDPEPKWKDSCGPSSNGNDPEDLDIGPIVGVLESAYSNVYSFTNNYATKIFRKPFKEVKGLLDNQTYPWLRKPDYWRNGEVPTDDTNLLDIYEYFQRIAVGLEQAVYDQQDRELDFCLMYGSVIDVLCEIHEIIKYREVATREDVARDVMDPSFRRLDETGKRQRNFIVLKEFMWALNYSLASFNSSLGWTPVD